jgi:hypothetical protein
METSKKIILILSAILTLGIILNVNYSLDLHKEIEEISPRISENVEAVRFQTSTVPCKDTENYGSGSNRDRVCAHGTTAFCDWEYWSAPANTGSCTLKAE